MGEVMLLQIYMLSYIWYHRAISLGFSTAGLPNCTKTAMPQVASYVQTEGVSANYLDRCTNINVFKICLKAMAYQDNDHK